MEILIISGLSGGGKSKAASFLEDIGYYTVDNLPAEMMMKFAGFCAASSGRYDRVALVYDVRSGEPTDMLIDTLEQLKASGVNCRMLFLEADTPTIINRYKETRRMHPLQAKGLSVEEAVRRERALMQPVRDHADFVLDGFVSFYRKAVQALNLFGAEHCAGDRAEQDFTGKVLVLSPDTLKESCWSQADQLWYAHDGFGCRPHAIGRSVRCTCLGDGEMTRWNRHEFIGVLDEKYLPDWAREKLMELTAPRQEEPAAGEMKLG